MICLRLLLGSMHSPVCDTLDASPLVKKAALLPGENVFYDSDLAPSSECITPELENGA